MNDFVKTSLKTWGYDWNIKLGTRHDNLIFTKTLFLGEKNETSFAELFIEVIAKHTNLQQQFQTVHSFKFNQFAPMRRCVRLQKMSRYTLNGVKKCCTMVLYLTFIL